MDASAARRRWMSVLARAPVEVLERAWQTVEPAPAIETLRAPETGLVMLRGRAGGTGQRFNLGEMTVTRCAVRCGEAIGQAYVKGRDKRHAELAARLDALLQADDGTLRQRLVEPLAETQAAARAKVAAKAAATKVEFFTMVRGEA